MMAKNRKPSKRGQARVTKATPSIEMDLKTEVVHETVKVDLTSDSYMQSVNIEDANKHLRLTAWSRDAMGIHQLENQSSEVDSKFQSHLDKGDDGSLLMSFIMSSNPDIVDMDADHKDPQLCSL